MSGRNPRRFAHSPKNAGAECVNGSAKSWACLIRIACLREWSAIGDVGGRIDRRSPKTLQAREKNGREKKPKREKKQDKRVTFRAPGKGPAGRKDQSSPGGALL